MPLPDKGPAPYAPGRTVLGFIHHVRDRGIPAEINEGYVGRIPEVGESYARRTLRALEMLDLVDPETRRATPTLTTIKEESSDRLQTTLAEWFTGAYAPVLRFVNPSDAPDVITNQFRPYTPDGQRERMVQLFLSLAAAAGLISEVPKRPRGATAQPKTNRAPKPQPASKPKIKVVEEIPPIRRTSTNGEAKDRYLNLLISLAEKAEKPDPDLLDRIERVLLGVSAKGEAS